MLTRSTTAPLMLILLCANSPSLAFQTFAGYKQTNHARYLPVTCLHDCGDHGYNSGERRYEKPIWAQLQQITEPFQEESGRVMFNVKELEKHDADIVSRLKQEASIQFEVPKTWKAAISTFLGKDTIQFILSVLSATLMFRLSLPEALGLTDVATIVLTRLFWEAQEWAVHSHWFHGNEGGTAYSPFETHDNHHMLPYNHVAIESIRMCAVWFTVVASIATAAVNILHVPAAVASTSLVTYISCGLTYIGMHYMTHTKVPLTGWLQQARQNHIKHHLSPEENLNMGPNNVDRIMKTHSY